VRDTHLITCDACEKSYEVRAHSEVLDDGWQMNAQQFGYYNGFSDSAVGDEADRVWNLCHDCIVTLLTALPRLGERLGKGQHPSSRGDKPCCRWCWSFHTNDDGSLTTLLATDDGQGWQVASDEELR
jgi:hypothetical protein